eukprot:1159213-Pelagomonas_calceolata.AAC.3
MPAHQQAAEPDVDPFEAAFNQEIGAPLPKASKKKSPAAPAQQQQQQQQQAGNSLIGKGPDLGRVSAGSLRALGGLPDSSHPGLSSGNTGLAGGSISSHQRQLSAPGFSSGGVGSGAASTTGSVDGRYGGDAQPPPPAAARCVCVCVGVGDTGVRMEATHKGSALMGGWLDV